MVAKVKKSAPKKPKLNIIIIFAVFLALLLGIYYISNSDKFNSLRGQQEDASNVQIAQSEEASPGAEVLDCSKQVAQGQKLLASEQKSDCLFIGCGDFFQ